MLSPEQVERIDETLLARFGRVFDKPKYRITWSSSAREARFVEGTEYIGNIKLRDVKKIQMMPKYPRDRDRWILEILVPVPEQLKHELVGDNGLTYEPVWIFKTGNVYQEPTESAIYFLAYLSHYPIETVVASASDIWKMDKKEFEECLDIINNELPDIAVALKNGSAAFMDSSKVLK